MFRYDVLTKPRVIKDFYENKELVELTKALTEEHRKSRTIDWDKRDDARAHMRIIVKKHLKNTGIPGREDALQTVIAQCERWTDKSFAQ